MEGIYFNVVDYGVNFGEDGVGDGNGGLGFEVNNNEIIVDWKLSEDNKKIFQAKSDAWQEQLLVQLKFSQNIGSHGKGQQVHGHFLKWMTIALMLIPFNFK